MNVARGATVNVSAKAYGDGSRIALESLEIVGHGETLEKVAASDPGQNSERLSIELRLPVEQGIWLAARTSAGPSYLAHSTPVYVTVDGGGFHNAATVKRNIERCESDLRELEQELKNPGDQLDSETSRHVRRLERQIAETRETLRELSARLKP